MATKKKVAKAESIDDVVSKGYDGVNKDLADLQTGVRVFLTNIGEALSEKLTELEGLSEAVKGKQDELTRLYGAERALQELEGLREALADAKRQHQRELKALEEGMHDREAEIERELNKRTLSDQIAREDAARARRIAWEDEDRTRELAFAQRNREQDDREQRLEEREKNLLTFDARIKDEVEKRVGGIKQGMEFKHAGAISNLQAEQKILEARNDYLENEKEVLLRRLEKLEQSLTGAQARMSAIATSALDKESGKAALDELRQVAHKQAESKK